MRNVLALLVAVVFLLYSSVLAAAPARACCKDADCPIAQCVATACAPSALPAAVGEIAAIAAPALREAAIPEPRVHLPQPASDIWCPPD